MTDALENLIAKCAEARHKYEQSEIDYYEFLFGVKELHQDVWGVFTTFERFIERCVGRPNPARWTEYLRARTELGIEKIRAVGIPSALEALKIEDNRKLRSRYIDEMVAFSETHHGVHASEQHAREIRGRIAPNPARATPSLNRMEELDRLRLENATLRRELAAVTRERDRWREQATKLGGSEAESKGRARKSGGKGSESRPS